MLPWALEVLDTVAITSTAQGLLMYWCSNSRPAGSTASPAQTPWELSPLHITCHTLLWRVNHLRLSTQSFESQVIIRQDNTMHHLYQHMLMPQSTHLRRPLKKNDHQSEALRKNRMSFHLGMVIFVHPTACHKEKTALPSKSLFLWDQTKD